MSIFAFPSKGLWAALPACLLFLSLNAARAQSVSGTVRSASENEPLPGVTVLVKGKSLNTTTDNKGHYALSGVSAADSLSFSYTGFRREMVSVGGRTQIDVSLETTVSALDQLVVIGYGTQKRSSVTASISKIQNEKLDQVPATRIETALAGRLAGVNISTDRNIPGAAPTVSIRGQGSISGGNAPLIVIDGFPGGSLGQLDMNDVESVEVLKDASSAAIYGSRGAGGVILITTKRGSTGKPALSLNAYYGFAKPMVFHDWLTGDEWYDYLVKYQNREFAWNGGDVSIPMFGDPRRPTTYQVNPLTKELPQTIWQDEITQTAPIQSYNLSVKGGTENVRYYVSGTYENEEGAIKTAFYQTYSFRANLDVRINKVVSLGMELNPYFSKRRIAGSNMVSLVKYPPFVSPDKLNGKYPRTFDYIPTGHSGQASPYTFLYGTKNYVNAFSNIGRAFINFNLMEGLSLKSSVGTDIGYSTTNNFHSGIGDVQETVTGSLGQTQSINLINENVLSYNKTINDVHDIEGILGASYQRNSSQNISMAAVNNSFNNDIIETLNNAIINPSASTQTKSKWGLISYFARVNYAYKEKYLLAASFRSDGSSRFGSKNKWGYFPSASAAWRVSNENFMQSVKAVSELKLRASYGVTGNFNIGDFQYLGAVGNVVYSPDNQTVNGIAQTTIENPLLSWEKVKGYDLGLELGMFDNRLNINFDYYDKRTDGMLYNVNIPAITGFTNTIQNIGVVRNHGVDVEINTRNLTGEFKWNTAFNFSHNKNEVVDLGGVDERINELWSMGFLLRKGVPMFSYYGYKMIGVFQNQEQIDKLPHLAGTKPGNPIIKDVNGDGKIDTDHDRVVLGNFQPKMQLGMANDFYWRKFDLSIAIQASLGAKIFNAESQYYQGNTLGAMRRSVVENQWWSEDDPGDGMTPAAALSQLFGYNTNTDYYIEDASFVNIRNVNLGYNLSDLVGRKGIKSLRVYVSVGNLLIIKNKDNHAYNPEGTTQGDISGINSTPGVNFGSEPINRTIVLGVNVGF
ncbi:TonB-dependent receptor [Compostibacter hankyongensis]|uniref:TonB-dependent receptor n=1 Tax=Compostibacter hankyongensis TaxID=1007089 RepID=A0ABP8FN89_9BACT